MSNYILKIEDLRLNFYTYEGIVEALDAISMNLKEGETLGIVGETGCGKSVTGLSILVIVPSPGKIEDGRIILKTNEKTIDLLSQPESSLREIRGRFISMVFQDPRSALNPVYTVGDQIIEVLLLHKREEIIRKVLEKLQRKKITGKATFVDKYYAKIYNDILENPRKFYARLLSKLPILRRFKGKMYDEAKEEAIEMLRIMKISDPERVVNMYPHEISGGMAQRIVIAIALACSPHILIADEPTTNLDVTVQLQILQLIKELKESFASSVIYITHDMGVIAEMCDRVAVMYAGNVVEIADVIKIFKKPLHPYTQGLLESIPRPGFPFKSIEGAVPSLINPPKGCRFHNRCRYAMEICFVKKPEMLEPEKEHFVRCFLYS